MFFDPKSQTKPFGHNQRVCTMGQSDGHYYTKFCIQFTFKITIQSIEKNICKYIIIYILFSILFLAMIYLEFTLLILPLSKGYIWLFTPLINAQWTAEGIIIIFVKKIIISLLLLDSGYMVKYCLLPSGVPSGKRLYLISYHS